jgi:hypothetical protein
MATIADRNFTVFLLVLGIWITANVDTTLGLTYLAFEGISLYLISTDKNRTLPYARGNRTKGSSFITALLTIGIFYFTAALFIQFLQLAAGFLGFFSIVDTFANVGVFFRTDVLQGLLNLGLIAGFIEARFFAGTFLEFMSDFFKVGINARKFNFFVVSFIVGVVFVLFHIRVKGLPFLTDSGINNVGLFVTFVFAMFQSYLSAIFKQVRESAYMHSLTNSIAVLKQAGFV